MMKSIFCYFCNKSTTKTNSVKITLPIQNHEIYQRDKMKIHEYMEKIIKG